MTHVSYRTSDSVTVFSKPTKRGRKYAPLSLDNRLHYVCPDVADMNIMFAVCVLCWADMNI